jgi:hypothetical protein
MKVKETLPAHRYIVRNIRASVIDPSFEVSEDVDMKCPRCHRLIGHVMEHNETMTHRCGLTLWLLGNALVCTIDTDE